MKPIIQLLLGTVIIGLLLFGCDSIIDQEPVDEMALNADNTFVAASVLDLTMDMCRNDPGWKALGYKNLGQCLRYTQSGTGSAPTVTDIDGNVYPIVKIGEQWWMAENLTVSRYLNGDQIPNVTDSNEWADIITGAWTNYENDPTYDDVYGKLYNWFTLDDTRGLCPTGWHIPSDEEWNQLVIYLGGADIAGNKMKNVSGWQSDGNGTNESGFSGLPGGGRDGTGNFYIIGYDGYWWSSSVVDIDYAWYRGLNFNISNLMRGYVDLPHGLSVRCVLD
jgi:uncharacterized protein (TIGR02145 family)